MTASFRPIVAALVFALAGCTPPVPSFEPTDVTGTVTFDGKPAGGLTIGFEPASGVESPAVINVDAAGKFTKRLIPGNYFIAVTGGENKDLLKQIPKKYETALPENKVTIAAGQPVTIALTK